MKVSALEKITGPITREDGFIAANPAARPGRYVKIEDRRGKFGFLTPAEGRLFLDTARERSQKFYPIFLTALRTGMRQGEILGLQWGDIDWNGKFIEIRRASWNRIVTTPKNGKSRRVDMSDQLAQVLSEHRLALSKAAMKKGATRPPLHPDHGRHLRAPGPRRKPEGGQRA